MTGRVLPRCKAMRPWVKVSGLFWIRRELRSRFRWTSP